MKRILCAVLALLAVVCCIAGCDKAEPGETVKLSFKSASGYEYLKKMNGQSVTINGYLATSSPADGSFIFLMNLPFQSCPFCVPNTTELSNTIEVYPKKGKTFTYTDQAVRVVGKLEVAPSQKQPFTDLYGYEFSFKIVDAEYFHLKADEMSENMAKFAKFSETGLVNDLMDMLNFVHFTCNWPEYSVQSWVDSSGQTQPGYYLYAADAYNAIYKEGAQFAYGIAPDYFPGLLKKAEQLDDDMKEKVIENINAAMALSEKGLAELNNGNYTSEKKYMEEFGNIDDKYTLTNGEALMEEYYQVESFIYDLIASCEV